jgi:hypothetical protein
LACLGVEHSPIDTPLAGARFLSRVFPNLRSIRANREGLDDFDDDNDLPEHVETIQRHTLSDEVQLMLHEILAIHEQERMLARESIT